MSTNDVAVVAIIALTVIICTIVNAVVGIEKGADKDE